MLSQYEKETIITGNEEDNAYTVYTYNEKLRRELRRFAGKHPKLCVKTGETADGCVTWRILKENLAIAPVEPEEGLPRRRR